MSSSQGRVSAVLMIGFALLSGNVFAALQWQDNSISYTTSNQFTEPGVTKNVAKHIVEFVHVNGYELGNNLFRAKVMRSDSNDPAKSGDKGATEVYVVYRHLLSLTALTGEPVGFGPVRDVGLTAGFDLNTKNNAFGPRKRLFVAGPTFRFDVPRPAMLDLSLLAAKEYNHCGLPPCRAPGNKQDIGFDPFALVYLAWRFPLQVGEISTRFEGFAAKGFRRGTDYVGNDVGKETLMRTALLADVGKALAGEPDTFFAGVGYELWRNKYGATGVPGTNTDAFTFNLRWHF